MNTTNTRRCATGLLTAALVIPLFAARLRAQESAPLDEQVSVCGKSRSAARQFHEDPCPPQSTPSVREAMGETDVLHYALDIEITNLNTGANNCTVTGTNVMTIRSKSAALSQFTFRLHSNYTITTLTVTDGLDVIPVTQTQTSTTTRVVTLNREYGMDEEFLLTIAYTGTSFSTDDSLDVKTQGGTPVVYTLSEPFGEYTWWPCKDGDVGQPGDNSDKATMEFNITAPNNYLVPSNGVLSSVEPLSGNRNRYHWSTNYPITPYLVSFAATNYHTWTKTYNYPAGVDYPAGSMPVMFYVYPGSDNASNRAVWEKCTDMIATYRTVYGEYPFINEKYGIYQFSYGGGMEHQTMTGEGAFDETLTAHELSHQWWGDMITCKTWSDIWLNEGFATYSECLWEERKAGGINTAAYFNAINARRPSGNGGGNSVYRYNTASLNSIFSTTFSYNKGAWILHMLRHIVGDATFFDILAAYRNAYKYTAATTNDFAAVAESVSGKDLTPFFNQYVYQKGAPAYQYGWQAANVAGQDYLLVRINQTQTAGTGSPPQIQSVYQMPVDLSTTISGTPQTLTVQNTARTQWFVVPTSAAPTAVAFDPLQWILRGVTSNVAYIPGPPKILAVTPAPGANILQPASPSQLTVTFHTPVDCTDANFTLVGANTGVQTLTLVSGSNVNPAVLNLPGPLAPDTYTLTITTGVTADNSGMALDGEIANPNSPASLPSGDGVAGGNAVIQFSVQPCNAPADIDENCLQNQNDIDIFTQVLLGLDTDSGHIARCDLDASTFVDGSDIALFVAALTGP